MAKDPIFPLYYNDIDRSTKTWTDEEFGAYMRLLMEQWDKGSIPNDYQRLTRIATSLDKNWPLLKDKFEIFDGVLKNNNLEVIREKRNKHKEKQKENVSKRYQKSTKQDTKIIPLEDEYEKENEKVLIIKESIDFDVEDLFKYGLDEIYINQEKIKWPHINFEFELNTFKNKVRGSPGDYINHDTSGIRKAFQYQLRHAKDKKDVRQSNKGTLGEFKSFESANYSTEL
jgi:uncharacterized protein YdaU (DUF1376 family)